MAEEAADECRCLASRVQLTTSRKYRYCQGPGIAILENSTSRAISVYCYKGNSNFSVVVFGSFKRAFVMTEPIVETTKVDY
jgi:hypothetical protein